MRSDGRFEDLYDYVHIDEKWFLLNEKQMFLLHYTSPRKDAYRKHFFMEKPEVLKNWVMALCLSKTN